MDLFSKTALSLLFMSAMAAGTYGQDVKASDSLLDMSLEALLQMEVTTATKSVRKASEIPVIIDVITKEEIKNRGYRDLGQLMNDLRDNNTDGYNWGIGEPTQQNVGFGFRFDTKQNMLFLFNGQRINAFMPGNLFGGEDYLLPNVERVEIIRGPGSSIYGPNAFTSVINIITTDKKDLTTDQFMMSYGASPTSLGSELSGSVITPISDGRLSLGFRYESEEGQNLLIQNGLFGDQRQRDGLLHALDGNFVFEKGDFLLQGKATNQSRNTFTGFNGISPTSVDELTLDMYAYSLGAAKTFQISDGFDIKVSGGWHQDNWTETAFVPLFQTTPDGSDLIYDENGFPLLDQIEIFRNSEGQVVSTSFFIDGQGADSRNLEGEILAGVSISEKSKLTLGFNVINEKVLNAYRPTELYLDPAIGFTPYSIVRDQANNWLFDVDAGRTVFGLFAQYEWDIIPEKLFMNVGGRIDKFSGTGVLSIQDYTEFNPKAGIVYLSEKYGNFKGIYSTATRVPNGFETLSSVAILGNPSNSPEHLTSFQFEWQRDFNRHNVSLGYFNVRIEDKLETNADLSGELLAQGFVGQFINVGSDVVPKSSGINGRLRSRFGRIDLDLNFTKFLKTDDGVGNQIPYIPTTMINANLNVPVIDALNINLGANYRDQYTQPADDLRDPIGRRIILRLHAYSEVSKSLTTFLTIDNLLNASYNYPSSSRDFAQHFPARGIQILGGMKYKF